MRTYVIATFMLACLTGTLSDAASAKRPIGVDDLVEVRIPSQVSLSPDGRTVAYMLATPSLAKNSYTHDLYVVDADGKGIPRRLVAGEAQTGDQASMLKQSPVWAPGSDRLVFVMTESGRSEIRTFRLDTLESEVLVSREMLGESFDVKPAFGSAASLGYSPDGRRLAFLASHKAAATKADESAGAIEADEDWTPADRRYLPPVYQLFMLDLDSRVITQLTPPSVSVASFDWSPDSKRLAISARNDVTTSANTMSSDIYVVDVTTRAMHPLVTLPGMDESPIWSPDGRAIAFGSQRGQEDWMYALTLSTVPADGSAPPSHIGERELDSLSGSHMMTPVRWSEDSRYVDVVTLHDMSSHLFRVRVSDGAAERLTPRLDRYYDQFSYSRDGKRVVFVAQGVSTPADVFVSGAQKLEPKALTDCNPEWRELRVPVVDRVKWRSADGKWELNGLLLLPSDHQRNRRYPMLTNIRGGPSMVRQDLNAIYNYPLVVLAEQGYVIFIPNSRGRQGYGMELTHAIRDERNYVLNPMSDVLSGVEALVERGVADPDRLGVLGFSYGGTLTANIVTHTNRFRAAIYGEGSPNVLADIQNYGHSKFLGLNRDMWGFGNPFEPGEIERAFQQSAVYRLDKVKTPVLIEAGEKSAWEGDRQLYRGLKHFGVPSEFWVYPRSGHGWDEPLLKQDAFNRHIVWFDYWIKGKPYPDEKKRAEYDAWRK